MVTRPVASCSGARITSYCIGPRPGHRRVSQRIRTLPAAASSYCRHTTASASRLVYRALSRSPVCSPSRSEEHTSELQSLMRTSYAVFGLTQEKQHQKHYTLYILT